MNIQRILLATDFSPNADRALAHALLHAEKQGAELHIFHNIVWQEPETIFATMQGAARLQIEEALERHRSPPLKIVKITSSGRSTAKQILAYVRNNEIDLVVMGTHGHRPMLHYLLGSVAEEVVRKAPCPVITVRGNASETGETDLRRILVPVDFLPHSTQAVIHGQALAQLFGATLGLVFVVEDEPFLDLGSLASYSRDQILADLTELYRKKMDHLVQKQGLSPSEIETHILTGKVVERLLEHAEAWPADLIVLGTHGRSGLNHLMLGSNAERLIRLAPCPVYTVKAPPEHD